jgi:hypothetical protein
VVCRSRRWNPSNYVALAHGCPSRSVQKLNLEIMPPPCLAFECVLPAP